MKAFYLSVLLTFWSGSMALYAQNATVVRDTLPTESEGADTSDDFMLDTISSEDLAYYGLEEKNKKIWQTSLTFSGIYDSNIFISENNPIDDFIWNVSPQITLEPWHIQKNFPHYFKITYNPSFLFFSNNPSEDTIEHAGSASYLYKGEVITFNAKHTSATESGASRDVGSRTERDIHTTQIATNFQIDDTWSILWSNEQKLRFYENQNDQHTWITEGFLFHKFNNQLTAGVGTKLGWTDITASPNQNFQQGLFKISYAPHPDWMLDLTGGAEVRSFQGATGVDSRVTPVFSSLISYRIFPETKLVLSGYRNVKTSSGITANNYVGTGTRMGVEQSFMRRFHYSGAFGAEYTDYYNTSTATPTFQRDDLFYYTSHQLNYRYNEFLSFGVEFTWMLNESNRAEFTSNRAGFSTTITY